LASEAKGAGALYGVGFGSANLLKLSLVMAAVTLLAIFVLALTETTNTAAAEASRQYNGNIAFSHTVGYKTGDYSDIFTVNPDGTGLTNLTPGTGNSVSERDPALSPDGAKIAFSSDLNASKSDLGSNDIYVMDADGSNTRKLTNNDNYRFQEMGSWSPDGTKIVLSCYGAGWGHYEICRVDADGSNYIRLTTSENSEDPAWSPDGTKIAFIGSGGIHTMNPDGSNQTLAIAGDQPDWSPDGTKMAYRRIPPGQSDADIFVANADGSNPLNLTAKIGGKSADGTESDEAVPAWSPDGTKIAFSSNRGEKEETDYEIYVIDANGRDLKRLTHAPGVDWGPDWQTLAKPTKAMPEKQQQERLHNQQQQQPQRDHKSRSVTVHPPGTGGLSLLWVASALPFCGGVLFYAGVKRRM
jgi:Tol biopolymer transport system component